MKEQNLPKSDIPVPEPESMSRDPLGSLVVFDRLEVGPARLEKQRVRTPYRLTVNGIRHETELIYRYEEDVFDPNDPGSQNLANMITAQVAINYGLFCRSIVFQGAFDSIDRRFINHMIENTCREIYVKKFLESNPFLIPPYSHLPAQRYSRYTRASVEFNNPPPAGKKAPWKLWSVDRDRHAILSSGGKDSLLSQGLLAEMGFETHPIFINESGRHWLTAYNSFHYFKKNIPNSTRVWTNSDQLFSWFVRHFPFIRKDFHGIRSDEYPIRLWTVAVFLFGALPILYKRGAGRVIIGDEYDTSSRMTFKGITHYNGLYDQSRFFDNALSRYYLQKGWSLNQFSILRPLSELLIQKILIERFPELQAHQVSCHAAHKVGDRVRPCGKCEKCRRIVSMIMAIDGDPRHCGYTSEQIENCLKDFQKKGAAQESAGVMQLRWMLEQKDLLPKNESGRPLQEHQEILKLRYDPERSPAEGIPQKLRKPLIKIWMQHARGAMQRSGRTWNKIDPFSDLELEKPYAFELRTVRRQTHAAKNTTLINTHIWGELSWPEAQQQLQQVDIALLPVGSIEQHGPHLPLDTDAFDAEYLANQVARACSHPKPLILPLIPYGVSYEHNEFKGTLSISNDTLTQLIYDIGMSLNHNGIKKLVIINGHGGNTPALNHAAQKINQDAKIFVCVDSGETSDIDIYSIADTPNDVHAGEIETSTSLAVRPHLVKMQLAKKSIPKFSSRYLNFTSKRWVSWYAYTKNVSSSGVLGDPTKASVEKGEKIWQVMIAHLVSLVEDLKHMTLDEIHNRKY